MVGQHRLVVFGDEAEIGAVGREGGEVEIAVVQAEQHGRAADGVAHGEAGRGRIERDLLARGPVVVPPREERTRALAQQDDGKQAFQATAEKREVE